jgi:hypothetical protein
LHARVWSTPAQGGARWPTGFRPDVSTCAPAGSYDFSVSYAVGKVQKICAKKTLFRTIAKLALFLTTRVVYHLG